MSFSNRPMFVAIFAVIVGAILGPILSPIVAEQIKKINGGGEPKICGITGHWKGEAEALKISKSNYEPIYKGSQPVEVYIACEAGKIKINGTAGVPKVIEEKYGIKEANLYGESEIKSADPFDIVVKYTLKNKNNNPKVADHHRASGAYVARIDPTKDEIFGYYVSMSDLTKKVRPKFPFGFGRMKLERK